MPLVLIDGGDAAQRADGADGEIEAAGPGGQVGDHQHGEDADDRAGDPAQDLPDDQNA